MTAVLKHELRAYFHSLTAYVFGAFLLAFVGIGAMMYNLQAAVSNFEYVLSFGCLVFVVIVPILTMRVIAEERKQKTDQLLYSLPITTTQVVIGKYLALLTVYLIPLCIICIYPLIFSQFGDAYLLTSYGSVFAFFVLGAALIAVGVFISSLTENQGFAAGIGIAVILLNYYSVSLSKYVSSTATGSVIALGVIVLALGAVIRYLTKNDNLAYVTYNATEEELQSYGLDSPELTISLNYTSEDEDGESFSDAFVLNISRAPDEKTAAEADETTEAESSVENGETDSKEEEITAYARVGESQIVYQISAADYKALTAAAYNSLRHLEVLSADFADIEQIDISLDGAEYTIASEKKGNDRTYFYGEEELDIAMFQSALEGLVAESFTSEQPSQQEEIGLTVYLDNENHPEVQIKLYRYDGSHCLAVVDGAPVSLVTRTSAVDLIEAVHAIVLD